ncbi:MAG TPA: redoxin domain-containing protein, partial [Caulifigura sp.]|nr:redoxin domain-containing protein [Caulifigura sp.]
MKIRISTLLILWAASFFVAEAMAADAPSVEQVLSAYRENRDRFSTMHVQLSKHYERLDPWRLERQLKAEQLEQMLASVDRGEPFQVEADAPLDGAAVLNQFRREGDEARRDLKEPAVFLHRKEFFQDGRQYQTRRWTWVKPMPELFPTAPLTPASFITDYNDYQIHSWTERQSPPGRHWNGHHTAEKPSQVYTVNECEIETRPHGQPPFMGRKFPVDDADCPCEKFYSGAAENYRVVGTDTIDGRPCVVVECVLHRHGGQQMSRASIDMARGALPLRIQSWQARHGATFDMLARFNHYSVTTTPRIVEVDPGCWYPASMTVERFEPEPKGAQALMRMDPKLAAAAPPVPAVAFHRVRWECDLVERNFPHADDFFVLKFGPEHPVVDLEAQRREWDAKAEEPPRVMAKAGQPAPPLAVARWINSDTISLDDLRGRVVVLSFCSLKGWRSDYATLMKQLHAKYGNREVDFLTICMPDEKSATHSEDIAKWIKESGWTSPVAIDAGKSDEDASTTAAFGLEHEMAIVVIGPEGVVIQNDQEFPEGMQEDETLAEAWFKNWVTTAGEKWPIPEDLPMDEQRK